MANGFNDFCLGFGLLKFPFNTFTTEQELKLADKLFVPQGEYDPIIDAFKDEQNIILLGERGSGKTAILEDFKRHLIWKKSIFTILVDYQILPPNPESSRIYRLILRELLFELFYCLGREPIRIRKLDNDQRLLLSYCLTEFLSTESQSQLKEKLIKIQIPLYQRLFTKGYNIFRTPLNFAGSVGRNIVYEYLLKHFSFLPPIEDNTQIQEYFPKLEMKVDEEFFSKDLSLDLLKRIGDIIVLLGYPKPTVFFDRLDEDSRLENDAELISGFLRPFLTDGNLLSLAEIQIVFFIWSTPFRFLKEFVRTQKYYCPNLQWNKIDLERLLNRRLETFSGNKVSNYKELFESEVEQALIDKLFELSNSNPRDLLHIFKTLFNVQYSQDNSSAKILKSTVIDAMKEFVTNFNYYEYYPRKSNARANTMDIYSFASHLLKLSDAIFTKNQLNEKAGTGSSTNNYVTSMERIGLVENIGQESGVTKYRIKDSKIVYCLNNGIDIRKE